MVKFLGVLRQRTDPPSVENLSPSARFQNWFLERRVGRACGTTTLCLFFLIPNFCGVYLNEVRMYFVNNPDNN